jgi:phosphate transport system protein
MSKHFHRDLENLNSRLLSLSAMTEEMIDLAGRCLCESGVEVAGEVVRQDKQVDRQEVLIEEECLKMLALHQPVAIDLRRIATVLKINNDLERIGDLAVNIVKRAQCLSDRPDFPVPHRLEQMVRLAASMVRAALNAYVDFDAEMADEVCRRDDQVDELNDQTIRELIDLMKRRPELIEPAMHCFSATRQLERIADHATNVAEDVIYLVQGEIVRHQHSGPAATA